jgi:hypothetical protein
METMNAALPSKVLDVEDDHRCFPIRLPTIDAWGNHRQLHYAAVSTPMTHQSISNSNGKDTCELKQPSRAENSFNRRADGQGTTILTLPAKQNRHTLSADKSDSESRSRHLYDPGTRS